MIWLHITSVIAFSLAVWFTATFGVLMIHSNDKGIGRVALAGMFVMQSLAILQAIHIGRLLQ